MRTDRLPVLVAPPDLPTRVALLRFVLAAAATLAAVNLYLLGDLVTVAPSLRGDTLTAWAVLNATALLGIDAVSHALTVWVHTWRVPWLALTFGGATTFAAPIVAGLSFPVIFYAVPGLLVLGSVLSLIPAVVVYLAVLAHQEAPAAL